MEVKNKMNEKQLQDKINGTIWSACDTLRSSIPGGNYKDYALVMLFVKYLSDTYKEEKEKANEMYKGNEQMIERYLSRSKFILKEECTFDYLYNKRNEDNIGEIINKALETITTLNGVKLLNLFAGVDFNSEVVFGKKKEKNAILKTLLSDFNNDDIDLRPSKIGNLDVIGNAYEYLIARFAGDSGKKGGEFYTPAEVSTLLAKLVEPKENDRIYDPACGSGSLLLKAAKEIKDKKVSVYGQESNSSTYNLCRMNMFLHGVNDAHIEWGDTLANPLHLEHDDLMKFDVIVSNPPFSLDKWAKGFESANSTIIDDGKKKNTFKMEASMDPYNRFEYGVPPKSIGDYAFYGCSNITSLKLSSEIMSIGEYAFYDCGKLNDIELPIQLRDLGDYAFCGCSKITSIEVPAGVTRIGNAVFLACKALKNLQLPDGITKIGNEAFCYCNNLIKIEIPDKVISIGTWAFQSCGSLTNLELVIPSKITQIGYQAFLGVPHVYYSGKADGSPWGALAMN